MEHLYLLVKTNINPKKQRTHMPLFNKLIFENGEVFLKDLEGNLIRTYQRNYFHLKSGIYEVKPEFPEPLIIEINDPIAVRSDFQAILNANVKGAVAQADIKGVIAQANAKGAIAHANAKGAKAFHYRHFLFKRISSSLVPFWKENVFLVQDENIHTTKISLGIPKEIFYAYKNNRELSNLQNKPHQKT